ncbi:tRNA-uridine aminocarboxypropyltransferase [Collimonas sp.]|jgi:DTW domain-containing protein YfiP|uniref:tRNA-uridine aminocarboxypropyltransferase n=1 Tax=Collimonas sp. TaxID=1963772 RepID=UPI002C08149C|nr:tRNA-uridine aminocarboxypropyltransferase [Collimonas sp.]HWX02079.1 tRNA-uridine aminocarboxypropyltransferase [Collimonas sp.]
MTQLDPVKRLICPRCLRPQRTCICGWITPTAHAVQLLILQHPLEVGQAKGSAVLLQLSLPGARLEVGEAFAEPALQTLLQPPPGGRTLLLYPDMPEERSLPLAAPPPLDPARLPAAEKLLLVVLDGTWRKSRKMLYLNPLLQQLPRLALQNLPASMPASRYLIRKAHRPGQLSTLEAACHALMQLEHNEERYLPLLTAFDGFVAQQFAYGER